MPRLVRIVVAGGPHHITQRGNNRQDVFVVEDDRVVYLEFQTTFRQNTQTGRPLGTDSFLSKPEHTLGRRVRALPVGRPRKQKKEIE